MENPNSGFIIKRLKYLENLKNKFWDSWKHEYLAQLTEIHGWTKPGARNTKIVEGGLYLIKQDKVPRLRWKLGLVTRIYRGRGDIIRSVDIKTVLGKQGEHMETIESKRSPEILIPLEIVSNAENNN